MLKRRKEKRYGFGNSGKKKDKKEHQIKKVKKSRRFTNFRNWPFDFPLSKRFIPSNSLIRSKANRKKKKKK